MDTVTVVVIFMLCFFIIMIWNLDRTEKVERLILEALNRCNARLDRLEERVRLDRGHAEHDASHIAIKLDEIRDLLTKKQPAKKRGRK